MQNPFDQFDELPAAPGGRPIIRKGPEPAKPQNKVVQDGYIIDPNTGSASPISGLPAKPDKGGEGRPLTEKDRNNLQGSYEALNEFETTLGTLRNLYADNLQGGKGAVLGLMGDRNPRASLPLAPTGYGDFDSTAGRMIDKIIQAYDITGGEANSMAELRARFGPYLPSSTDNDEMIEGKLRDLQGLLDNRRKTLGAQLEAAGMAPLNKREEVATVAEQTDKTQRYAPPPGTARIESSKTTRTVDNPAMAAIASQVGSMLAQGVPDRDILLFMRQNKVDPARTNIRDALNYRRTPDYREWRRQNPDTAFPVDATMEVPLEGAAKVIAGAAASPVGAYVARAGDAVTAGNLARLTENPERSAVAMDLMGRENPGAAFLGDMSGGILAASLGEAGLARLGMTNPGFLRALTADAGYGGAAGLSGSDADNVLGRLGDTLKGATVGGAASAAGQLGTKAIGSAVGGVSDPSVRALADAETPLTIGQAVGQSGVAGRAVKGVEDRLAGFSGVGDQVAARQTEGLQKWNSVAFDKALEPISGGVGGKYAEGAIEDAQQQVSAAFTNALAGKMAQVDTPFITQAAGAKRAIRDLPDRVASEVESSIDEVIKSYFDPTNLTISGENMQLALRELVSIKRAYRNDPLAHRIGKAVDQVESSIEALFKRQAPEVMPDYNAAKDAFRRVSILEDAVLRAKNSEGVFTPAQLGFADRQNAAKFSGKHAAASGKSPFHDFQRDGQRVLPNKVPDSGTGGRLAMIAAPGIIAGSGAGVGYAAGDAESGAGTGLTLAALLASAYTRTGQRALVGAAAKRGPAAQATGRVIKKGSRLIGHGAGSQAALSSARD